MSVHFNEVDDVSMMMISSGYYGSPDEHLVFINVIVGQLLVSLYNSSPEVEWYAVYHFLCLFISLWSLLVFFLHKVFDKKPFILFFLCVLGVGFHFFYTWQFTTTASLSAVAGLIYLHHYLQTEYKVRKASKHIELIIALILLVASSTMRFQVTVMIGAISFPYFIYELVQHKKVSNWAIAIGVFVLVMGLEYYNGQYYEGEWKEYQEWTYARGKNINENAQVFHSLKFVKSQKDITETEYYLARQFNYTNYFTYSNIKKIGDYTRHESLTDNWKYFYPKYFIASNWMGILFFVLFSVFALFKFKDHLSRKKIFASLIIIGLILIYLALTMVIKKRVFSSILIFHTLFVLYLFDFHNSIIKIRDFVLLCFLLVPLLFLQCTFVRQQEQANTATLKYHEKIYEKLETDKIYIPGILPFVLKHSRPFKKDYRILKNKNILFVGWAWHAPFIKRAFESKFNISSDGFGTPILEEFAFNDKVRFLCSKNEMELYTKYYEEDMGLKTQVKEISKGVYTVHPIRE